MAWNSANLMVTFRDPATNLFSTQGYCRACKEPVAWFKPSGFAGVVSMRDVTTTVNYQGQTLATAIVAGAQLHGCYMDGNVRKYARAFAKATGTPAPATPAPAVAQSHATHAHVAPVVSQPATPPPVAPQPAAPKPTRTIPEPSLPVAALRAWERLQNAITAGLFRILLYGPPGTGKTSFPVRMCRANGWACYNSLPLTEETDKSYLIGQWMIKGGNVEWHDGLAVQAARESHVRPVWLVLNEISHASSDCMTALFAVLDEKDLISFRLPNGETVTPHPENWHVIATTNDDPMVLPEPIRSRFESSILISHANPELVKSLSSVYARRMLCATSREYDIRHIIAWDRLMAKGMSLADAARIVWDDVVAQSVIDATRVA